MTLRYHTAQSLTEYSLVMGLVALACIGGVAVLGTQIQNQLGNSLGATPVQTAVTNPTTLNALAAPFSKQQGFFLTSQEIQQILAQSPTETLDLGNGKKITIPKPNFPELQETLGPNGSTELALALVKRMQEALKAQGIDPETVIPEMSFFANQGHQVSDKQKEGELLLAEGLNGRTSGLFGTYSGNMAANSYYRQQDAQNGQLVFRQNSHGQFEVTNFTDIQTGSKSSIAKSIESFALTDRIFFAGQMTKQTLANRADLNGLQKPFSQIMDVIQNANQTLFEETSVRGIVYSGKFNELPWLDTKKAANDACIMSKDEGCIRY